MEMTAIVVSSLFFHPLPLRGEATAIAAQGAAEQRCVIG